MVDIGESGKNSDGGVFANSNLGIAMNQGLLKEAVKSVLLMRVFCLHFCFKQ